MKNESEDLYASSDYGTIRSSLFFVYILQLSEKPCIHGSACISTGTHSQLPHYFCGKNIKNTQKTLVEVLRQPGTQEPRPLKLSRV